MTDDRREFDSDDLVNYLKFAGAAVDTASDRLYAIRPTSRPEATATAVESAIAHLGFAYRILRDLVGVQCHHCAHSMGTYTDGRPVSLSVKPR
jgi:hypothetical protein